MQIGNVTINGKLALAPMAGVTDLAFRHICREHGAALTVTEMVSAKALCYKDKKTPRLLELGADEHPAAAQIFGHEPDTMAEGAKLALEKSGCDIIDINMGCPAPKIVNNGDGSALMKDPELASKVIAAVVNAVDVPVTVKFRKGWDEKSVNCVEFAKMAEQSGAAAITLHGRTRSQQYSGTADWDVIREVKQAVCIPVFANGDVAEPEDAVRILAHTGADGVMIGRGSLGEPWLFERANALLETGICPALPPFAERIDTAVRQIELAAGQKANVTLAAADRMYPAKVASLSPVAVQAVSLTGSTGSATVETLLDFSGEIPSLRPGSSATVKIFTDHRENAVVVPYEAVCQRGEQEYVLTVRNGRAVQHAVTTGYLLEKLIEVREGLSGGEDVILSPPDALESGAEVEVLP